jgi:hypothetical protein
MPDGLNVSTPLAYAQAYARMGWHVFPLQPGKKQPLGRLVPRGMLDATTDAETISHWWNRSPDAGIGIALAPSGLVAIDVDPRNGGTETFDSLQAEHGSLRSEVMAFTGGGGEHHVFAIPHGHQISLPGTLGPGIDLKANGYIVVEPTHASLEDGHRKAYAWEASSSPLDGVVPSPLPDWLRSLRIDLRPARAQPAAAPVDEGQLRDAREALYILDADDHDQWIHAGMALHSTGWEHTAYALWCSWAQQSTKFDATEHRKRWASFHTDGDRSIRLSYIFAEAQRRGWKNPRAAVVQQAPEPAAQASACLPLVFAEDITEASVNIDQLVEDILTAGGLSVMYGESNSGKSFLACDMSCSIASGIPWLGHRTVHGAVLYVAGEGSESIKLRVLAWRQHHGVSPALAVVPVAINLLDRGADVQRIVAACEAVAARYRMPVGLIVVDTLARAFGGGNENASEDMGAVIAHADIVRERTKAHVMFVHHSGKDSAKGSRGHSSLKAATDTEIEVSAEQSTNLHTALITKQRDLSSRGEQFSAKFTVVKMGTDQWGKPVTTCVVESTDAKPAAKADRSKGAALQADMIVILAAATNRTLKRSELVEALRSKGYTSSPIYRAIAQLSEQHVISEVMNRVHLNGQGAPSKE